MFYLSFDKARRPIVTSKPKYILTLRHSSGGQEFFLNAFYRQLGSANDIVLKNNLENSKLLSLLFLVISVIPAKVCVAPTSTQQDPFLLYIGYHAFAFIRSGRHSLSLYRTRPPLAL